MILTTLRKPTIIFLILGLSLFAIQIPIFIDGMSKHFDKANNSEWMFMGFLIAVAAFCILRALKYIDTDFPDDENAQRSRR